MRHRRFLLVGVLIAAVCGAARAAAPEPVLRVAEVERVSLLNAPAWRVYYDRYQLTFTDPKRAPDLEDEVAQATATTPDGKTWELEYDVQGRVSDTVSTITYWTPQSFTAPKEGQVTVKLVTHGGRRFTAKTPPLKRALGFLAPVSPAPDAILTERRPQFRWKGAAATPVTLEVMGESVSGPRAWEAKVTGEEIRYNADGQAQPPSLLPNRRYTWVVTATVKEEPASYIQLMRVRFEVSAGRPSAQPPTLPGTLVWGNYYEAGFQDQNPCMVLLQSPSSQPLSAFVGPVGLGYPDLSPDGRKLLYATNDGIWLDDLEGRPPRRLAAGFCRDPRWSRDMKRVAFVKSSKGRDPGGEDLDLDIWVCDADGSHLHAVANERGFHERFPSWSPDGKWIVYRREPSSDDGQCLWVVSADGVGKHPVIATTVKGHPGYTVYHMGEQDWSPEGKRIATQFSANSPSGEGFSGLGVVSPEGGVVTPLVMVPDSESHLIPSLPRWSPEGTQIVYTSGIPSEYPDANPEKREVWVVNADGTGKPVRVTCDHSKSNGFSWRAVAPEKVRLDRAGIAAPAR